MFTSIRERGGTGSMETHDSGMTSREEMLEEVCRLLRQVLAGTLDATQAIDSWPPLHDHPDSEQEENCPAEGGSARLEECPAADCDQSDFLSDP